MTHQDRHHYEGTMSFTAKPKPEALDTLLYMAACTEPWPVRSRPRWLCWLLGHTPTECDSFQHDTRRCPCGATRGIPGLRVMEYPAQWWLRLCGDRRWRHTWSKPTGIPPVS